MKNKKTDNRPILGETLHDKQQREIREQDMKQMLKDFRKRIDYLNVSTEAWQLRIEKLEKYKKFHDHIKAHFEKEHPDWKVACKICGKTYEEIVNEKTK